MPDTVPMTFAGPPRNAHQITGFNQSKDAEYWALFWEQRTRKTPVLIDTVAYLFKQGRINAQLHIAPNGVHADYVREYLPKFLGDTVPWKAITWRASKAEQVGATQDRDNLLKYPGLAIVSINVDAIKTKAFRQWAAKYLNRRRVLTSVDESLDISAWNKRTKVALELGKRSAYRRILDGTPGDAKPIGFYYPCSFLKPGSLGFTSKLAFQARYAVMQDRCTAKGMRAHVVDPLTGVCPHCYKKAPEFSTIEDYQNLAELNSKLTRFSSRVLREQCADLPPKIYQRRTIELSKKVRKIYDQLAEEYRAAIDGGEVEASHVLSRMLRLQQISCNYLPSAASWVECTQCKPPFVDCEICGGYGFVQGAKGAIKLIDTVNPRIEALSEVVAKLRPDDQFVVWSRFRADRVAIDAWAQEYNITCARYDGSVDIKQRNINYDAFRAGRARMFNGDSVAGGRGLDLSPASCVIYYSNGWSLRFRRQSEDRTESLDRTQSTLYVDLVAENTIDDTIIDALREGRELAAEVLGDPQRGWI